MNVIAAGAVYAFLAVCCPGAGSAAQMQDIHKNTILLAIDTTLDSCIFPGFSASLETELARGLSASHFSVLRASRERSLLTKVDSNALVLSVLSAQQGPHILAFVCAMRQWIPAPTPDSESAPLVDITVDRPDTAVFAILVAKKIEENLRARYVCRLTIATNPGGALLSSTSGPGGVSPAVWDVPFGIIDVCAEKKGFLPKTIRLTASGEQTRDSVFIALTPRRFWHSKLFYPAIVSLAASAVCYGFEYYYYDKYRKLGPDDLSGNPNSFGTTFGTAQGFEYAGGVLLGVSGAMAVITFFW